MRTSVMAAGVGMVIAAGIPGGTMAHGQERRPAPAASVASMEAWLQEHPAIERQVIWFNGDGKEERFEDWPAEQKARMEDFFRAFEQHRKLASMRLPKAETFEGFYTAEEAFDIYAAHAAHVLYVEAEHLVPWSIERRPASELSALLRSSSYFARIKGSRRLGILWIRRKMR